MGSPIDVEGQYLFITFFTIPRLSGKFLLIVAKTHECNEVLDPTYTPGNEPDEQELFEAKQTFMFSVFNANLQTDTGKTIVRRHLANTDAQSVWKELS